MTMLPVAILAGGLATRLRPLTETVPKALLEVNGEPFIVHQLRLLQQNGIKRAVICAGFLGERISDFVGDGSRFDVEVSYSFDGQQLLGTGGALKTALPLLDEAFFVVYGDSYLPCDYASVQKTFESSGKSALMTVFHNDNQWDASNVEFAEGRIIAYDKRLRTERMRHIDYGLGVFNQAAFAAVPAQTPYDLADLYQVLLQQNQLAGHLVAQRFYEAGSFAGIEELETYLQGASI